MYRHSPSKYDLFRDAVLGLSQMLVDTTAFADETDGDPAMTLQALTSALVDATIANRAAGGLYRWEARYLKEADRAVLVHQLKVVNERMHRPLLTLRPD